MAQYPSHIIWCEGGTGVTPIITYMHVLLNCVKAECETCPARPSAFTRDGSSADSEALCHVYCGPAESEFHDVTHCGASACHTQS